MDISGQCLHKSKYVKGKFFAKIRSVLNIWFFFFIMIQLIFWTNFHYILEEKKNI